MRAELESRMNVRVLPTSPLPRDEAAAVAEIRSCLAQSDHSVHLLGRRLGLFRTAKAINPSLNCNFLLRESAASDHQGSSGGSIWSKPGVAQSDPRLLSIIEQLQAKLVTILDRFGSDPAMGRIARTSALLPKPAIGAAAMRRLGPEALGDLFVESPLAWAVSGGKHSETILLTHRWRSESSRTQKPAETSH